jgi:predicted amino acid racemase
MPEILLNLDALRQNARAAAKWGQKAALPILPVLKGLASHPAAIDVLQAEGYTRFAFADIDEIHAAGRAEKPVVAQRENRVLMQICPLSRVAEVVATFGRSFQSQPETLQAANQAAGRLGVAHEVILMVDLKEGREGMEPAELPAVLAQRLPHLNVAGIGLTLGCTGRRLPDDALHAELSALRGILTQHGIENPEISVGGSVFCHWLESAGKGCISEIRLGAHFMLGEDTYRNCDLPGAPYRRDVVMLAAEVLEVTNRQFDGSIPALDETDGYPVLPPPSTGKHCCALLDVGRVQVHLEDLVCRLPEAFVIGMSSNYMVLDVSNCHTRPAVGGRVYFNMGYWSMARLFRFVPVSVTPLGDDTPQWRMACTVGTNQGQKR